MAFIVEDGTGLIDANAYVSVAFADKYFFERNISGWNCLTQAKQAAIIKATDYIDATFGYRFIGSRLNKTLPQALCFPRVGLFDSDGVEVTGIPINLKKATCEYAIRTFNESLMPDPKVIEPGSVISKKLERVGPIEEETQYQVTSSSTVIPQAIVRPYPAADFLLKSYLLSSWKNYR